MRETVDGIYFASGMFNSSHATVAPGIDSVPPNPRYNVGGEAHLDPLPNGINFASPNIVVGGVGAHPMAAAGRKKWMHPIRLTGKINSINRLANECPKVL